MATTRLAALAESSGALLSGALAGQNNQLQTGHMMTLGAVPFIMCPQIPAKAGNPDLSMNQKTTLFILWPRNRNEHPGGYSRWSEEGSRYSPPQLRREITAAHPARPFSGRVLTLNGCTLVHRSQALFWYALKRRPPGRGKPGPDWRLPYCIFQASSSYFNSTAHLPLADMLHSREKSVNR